MPKKLLLADDSLTIHRVVELTFADEDFEVISVANGTLAIEKIESVMPDVIIADVNMPEKDGYEVCAYVKNNPKFSSIPVLLLKGTFEPFNQERADEVRADGIIQKPFQSQTLIDKVNSILGMSTSTPGIMQMPAPAAEEIITLHQPRGGMPPQPTPFQTPQAQPPAAAPFQAVPAPPPVEFTPPLSPQPVAPPQPPQPPIQFGHPEPEKQVPQPPLDFGGQMPGVQPPPVVPAPPQFDAAAPAAPALPQFDAQPPAPPIFDAPAPAPVHEAPAASPVPAPPEMPVMEESVPPQPPIIEEDAGMPVLDDTPFGVSPSPRVKAATAPPTPVQPIESRMEELSHDASEAGKELSEAFFTPQGDTEEDDDIFSLDESSLDDEDIISMPQIPEIDYAMPDLSEQPDAQADFAPPMPDIPAAPIEISPEPAAPEMEIPEVPKQPAIPDFADAMGDVSIAFNRLANQPDAPVSQPPIVPETAIQPDEASIFGDTADVDISPEISSLVEQAGIVPTPPESVPLSQPPLNEQIPMPQSADDDNDIVAKVTKSVLSKISSDVIREIAWEVVPEIVDRILKEKQGQ